MTSSKPLIRAILVAALGCYLFGGLGATSAFADPRQQPYIQIDGVITLTDPTMTLSNFLVLENVVMAIPGQPSGTISDMWLPMTANANGDTYTWRFRDTAIPYVSTFGPGFYGTGYYNVMATYTDPSTGSSGVTMFVGNSVANQPPASFQQYGVSEAAMQSAINDSPYDPLTSTDIDAIETFEQGNPGMLFPCAPGGTLTGDYWAYSDGHSIGSLSAVATLVPEPASLTLLVSALLGLAGAFYLRQRRAKA